MDGIKKEYVDFVTGPYLEYNMYAVSSGYTWEEVNAINTFKSFFERGLKADMIIEGKTIFEIYIESILKGARYAVDDGGDEVKVILEMMLNGGRDLIDKAENILIGPILNVREGYDYMDEYACNNGLWVIGFLFKKLGTDMSRFCDEWDEIEADDDGPVNKIGCFQMIKFILNNL